MVVYAGLSVAELWVFRRALIKKRLVTVDDVSKRRKGVLLRISCEFIARMLEHVINFTAMVFV